jgi:hypothetical protein
LLTRRQVDVKQGSASDRLSWHRLSGTDQIVVVV